MRDHRCDNRSEFKVKDINLKKGQHRQVRRTKQRILTACLILLLGISARAQVARSDGAAPASERVTLQLGDAAVVIPASEGFEEAAAKFASGRNAFTSTEPVGNDMLAVHLLKSDCERWRRSPTTRSRSTMKTPEYGFSLLNLRSMPNSVRAKNSLSK